jgi:hypothetical protein
MTLTTAPPLVQALAAVERALVEFDVTPVRLSISSALHRVQYDDPAGDVIAALGWTDGLQLFDDELQPELRALITAHAHLVCASPPADVPVAPFHPEYGGSVA